MKIFERGSKKLTKAWAFYDWANSVYPLVISTAVFPIYYSSITSSFANEAGDISFLGMQWNPTTLYDYTLSLSFLIVAFFSPILSGIADYMGNKLKFLKFFCLLGSLSVMCLFFFTNDLLLLVLRAILYAYDYYLNFILVYIFLYYFSRYCGLFKMI